ncbi:MAG TPA: thiamine pyrophosphate-binding protein [Caulobacteraceae bacterium]|nr:thiamine pyrophosphate-binding protein [Caulobacteraceae bacterium]
MTLTGGELLARCLKAEGLGFVFGLPSPEVDPFLAALEPNGIRFVPVRHESAAVYMAEGLYKTTGQVAATVTNPGPGSANLLPGVINARHEGTPLIAITAQHRLDVVYPSPPSTFQGQDQLDVFRPAVKWGAPIFSWARISDVVRMAFREMWAGRPGPVQLEIPAPVMYAVGEEIDAPVLLPESYRSAGPQASAAQIGAAARLLAGAERPLIVIGSGVDRANVGEAVLEIAERLGCGVVTSMAGRSAAPQDHANHLYGYGRGADEAKSEADVILALGTRLGNLDTPFDKYWGDHAKQQLIQIDVDPRSLGVTRPLAIGIVSDLASALAGLSLALAETPKRANAGSDLTRYHESECAWREAEFAATNAYNGPGLHPAQVMQAVGRTFGREAIYAADGGFTSLWAHFMLPPTRARSYLNILELGMLGIGIPSAIGAKLGNPDRDVVCVTGDGAAGFHCMELQSAAREGAKVTVVVFAEGSWSMEVPNEQMLYGRTFGTEMGEVRWDKVAEGLGCAGYFAESMSGLEDTLAAARDAAGPALVCVRTNRAANMSVPLPVLHRFGEVYSGPSG